MKLIQIQINTHLNLKLNTMILYSLEFEILPFTFSLFSCTQIILPK